MARTTHTRTISWSRALRHADREAAIAEGLDNILKIRILDDRPLAKRMAEFYTERYRRR